MNMPPPPAPLSATQTKRYTTRANHVKGRQNEARAKRSHWLRRRQHTHCTHGMVEVCEGASRVDASNQVYEAGPTITFYLGKWGHYSQFCSDRPKTSDLEVSDGLLSIPAVAQARNIGSKKGGFFFGFGPVFLPYTPFFDLEPPRKTTDLPL